MHTRAMPMPVRARAPYGGKEDAYNVHVDVHHQDVHCVLRVGVAEKEDSKDSVENDREDEVENCDPEQPAEA